MNLFSTKLTPYTIARIWTGFVISAFLIILLAQNGTYFELDAFGIWILSCIAILYLSRRDMVYLTESQKKWVIIAGAFICIFSVVSIPAGFTHPPYSIGEFSIFMSGFGLIFFGLYGISSFLLPVSIPFIAVGGFSLYELFLRNQVWLTEPLVPLTTNISVAVLNVLGIPVVTRGSVFSFFSITGDPIALTIVSDCTGIMSLGTFTIAAIIILICFRKAITRRGLLWILLGYAGTYIANILRIVVISLSGYYFGPSGVIEQVHVNIGWIIFSLWMIAFWYLFFTRVIGISVFTRENR